MMFEFMYICIFFEALSDTASSSVVPPPSIPKNAHETTLDTDLFIKRIEISLPKVVGQSGSSGSGTSEMTGGTRYGLMKVCNYQMLP